MKSLCESCSKLKTCIIYHHAVKVAECNFYVKANRFDLVSESIKTEKVYRLEPDGRPHYMLIRAKSLVICVQFICKKLSGDIVTLFGVVYDDVDYRQMDTIVDVTDKGVCSILVNNVSLEFDSGEFKSICKTGGKI